MVDQALQVIAQNPMIVGAATVGVAEVTARLVKTDKQKSLFRLVAVLFTFVAGILDKAVPDRTK